MHQAQVHASHSIFGDALRSRRLPKLLEILVVFAAPVAVLVASSRIAPGDVVVRGGVILVATALMLAEIWLAQRLRGETMADLGLARPDLGLRSLAKGSARTFLVIVVTIGLFVLAGEAMGLVFATGTAPEVNGYEYLRGNPLALLGTLAMVYVSASFGEEVIYRGYLISRFEELVGGRHAAAIACLLAGLVFGLAHYAWGVVGVVQTTVMGLCMGLFYLRFGRRLWVNIVAHGFMDTLLFVMVYAKVSAGA